MDYYLEYEELDKHWLVIKDIKGEHKIVMRFPSRDQAERYIEKRTVAWGRGENNSEKEG